MASDSKPVLQVGHRYLVHGQAAKLVELQATHAVLRPEDGGKLVIVERDQVQALPAPQEYLVHAHMQIGQEEWGRLTLLRDRLEEIDKRQTERTEALRSAAKELDLSERQMFRLMATYRNNPSILALRAAKTGRKAGARMLGHMRESIISKCIEDVYLVREKPTIAKLYEAVEAECLEAGVEVPSMNALRLRVKSVAMEVRTRRREGRKRARETCKSAAGHLAVERILERIEIDHTLVDVILRADTPQREVIGRPWLTVAIDCRSRMVLGFYLSFERPSAASVAMCLAMAALPKAPWLEALGIAGRWPAEGIPQQIWVDNAMEFRSEALKRGCERYQIQLCFRPVGSPEFGATVERLIGTLMGMVHVLPGTTQSNVAERGDYDAEARAVMTLSEFIPWFAEQVVTRYHLSLHRGLGMPPINAWEEGTAGMEIKRPRDAMEFYASFLPAEARKLTRTGVQIHTVGYWSDAFSSWLGQDKDVEVHYHRMDLERVYVRLPDGTMTVAHATQGGLKGVTLDDLRRRQGDKRLRGKDKALIDARHQGYRRNRARLEAAQEATDAARGINRRRALPAPAPAEPAPATSATASFSVLFFD